MTPVSTLSLPLARLLDLTADAVMAVRDGRSLNDVLARCPADARPGVQALSFHALRWLGSASELRALLAPKTPPPNVDALLTTALALLWPGEPAPYAEHTLVDQAVNAARQRTPAAAGFINAVLRRFLRERETLVAAVRRSPLGAYNHPLWWVERVRADWPQHWQALLQSANQHPPMTLRVNARRSSGAAYVQRLAAQGRAATLLDDPALGGQAVVLAQPSPVGQLPGFAEGEVSVQDAAAQRAAGLLVDGGAALQPGARVFETGAALQPGARLFETGAALQPGARLFETGAALQPGARLFETGAALQPGARLFETGAALQPGARLFETGAALQPGARVLDACAAPGGKTAHLLERADLDLLALDSDPLRLARVQDTLNRLHLKAELKAGDARDPARWWDGRRFAAILLDAPCSASGIVRRHPDVRWLRRPADITALARLQAEMLEALWPLLEPGGRLLYATCSLFKAEGQAQIEAFSQRHGPTEASIDPRSPGHLLPLADNPEQAASGRGALHDGFFYALIHKH